MAMWQIVDNTSGRIFQMLERHWSGGTAKDALESSHGFGAAMDIADELTYLGFKLHEDFDVRPARATVLPGAPAL
jgi:hypothetical protein